MKRNSIISSVDFNKDGIQHGFLKLPYSHNESAWGSIMIPISQFKNGNGPTAIITGGNHGDEYEGPIALFNFALRNKFNDIKGRVIIIPAMNYPAFQVGNRVSPIDNVNLNRAFPGKANGTVTQIIADYFSRTLLPLSDFVLDFHSGGKTLNFLPFVASHKLEDKSLNKKCEQFVQSFGAPYAVKMIEIDPGGMYDTQAENLGKIFITTELGGNGTTSVESIKIAKRGINNFLIHAGILNVTIQKPVKPTITLDMSDDNCFVFSQHIGLLELCVNLEDSLTEGDLVGKIYPIERTGVPPVEYYAQKNGIVIAHKVSPLIKMGDTLLVTAKMLAKSNTNDFYDE